MFVWAIKLTSWFVYRPSTHCTLRTAKPTPEPRNSTSGSRHPRRTRSSTPSAPMRSRTWSSPRRPCSRLSIGSTRAARNSRMVSSSLIFVWEIRLTSCFVYSHDRPSGGSRLRPRREQAHRRARRQAQRQPG